MKRVLITGSNGQLGKGIVQYIRDKEVTLFPYSKDELDITDKSQIRKAVEEVKPDIIINCAAMTCVDDLESNEARAMLVNAEGPGYLAQICVDRDMILVHISTDYIFDGKKSRTPYTEEDTPSPLNVYGRSKLIGENRVRELLPNHFIIRTTWLYGEGDNFIEKVIALAAQNPKVEIVHDQWGSPTSVRELVRCIEALIKTEAYGTYNGACEGECTRLELTQEIYKYMFLKNEIVPREMESFELHAPRPQYCVLDSSKIKNEKIYSFAHWKDALREYLEHRQV